MAEIIEVNQTLLVELVDKHQVKKIRELFDDYNIVDLAEIVGELTLAEALFVFKVLRKEKSGDLFSYLQPAKQEKLISLLTSEEIKGILDNLYSDDIMEFMEELPPILVKKILASVSKEKREVINRLLLYKEDSCGSIMNIDYVELDSNDTIAEAMESIRKQREAAESISYGYVVYMGKLVGIISLRDVILAPEDAKLSEEMDTDFAFVMTNQDQNEAIDLIKKYDLTMIPVVDEMYELVGVITVDDVIDAMQEEDTEDIHKMAAMRPLEGSYMETSSLKISLSRLPWLLILMVSAAVSEVIITKNNNLIVALPALSYFIPMLMDTAGDAGSQSAAMVIRGMVVDGIDIRDFFTVLWKELRVALICGFAMFAANFVRVYLTMSGVDVQINIVSSLTLCFIIVISKLIGGVLPLLASLIKMDPAVMAAPLIATACDAVSLTLYFLLASFVV